MVVGTGARRVVEVRVRRPRPLRPIRGGGASRKTSVMSVNRCSGVTGTALGAEVDVVEFADPEPLVIRRVGAPSGGSQAEYVPCSRTESASGKYMTRPGNSATIFSAMSFQATTPARRSLL